MSCYLYLGFYNKSQVKQLATSPFSQKSIFFIFNKNAIAFLTLTCNLHPIRHCDLEKEKKISGNIATPAKDEGNHILSSRKIEERYNILTHGHVKKDLADNKKEKR